MCFVFGKRRHKITPKYYIGTSMLFRIQKKYLQIDTQKNIHGGLWENI